MSDDRVKCPTCDGCGSLDLAVWAPQLARVVTFVRWRGECGSGAVVKHLDTSGPNGVQLLRDAERLGFIECTGRKGRELQWRPRVKP